MFKLFSNHFSLIVAVIFLSSVCSSRPTLPTVRLGGQSSTPSKAQLPDEYRKLQMGFEQNFGQTDGRVRFLSRGAGYNLFLTNTEAVLSAKGSNNTGIAVDRDGFAYVAGGTLSRTFPVANPIQPALKIGQFSNSDAFVTKLNQTGSALVYSTFFGGTGDDSGFG